MKFRPCIDLHRGKVKQIVGGTLSDNSAELVENFISEHDAGYYAELFRKDGLTGGHVIMLGPGNQEEALKALTAYPNGLQIGGGINTDNAGFYLDQGASHVIVTSFVFRDGVVAYHNLKSLVKAIGKERLVLDLSCRAKEGNYYVVTDRWQKFTEFEINETNLANLAGYCGEFLIHAADVEGRRQGIEEELVSRLGRWASIPITYAGGIKDLSDLDMIDRLGQGKMDFTVGSALDIFGGKLAYAEVLQHMEGFNNA